MDYLPADLLDQLRSRPRRWLVTGAAGFIGSNLVECLLRANQDVTGLDNFATGHQRNLDEAAAGADFGRLRLVTADIRDRAVCQAVVDGVDVVLHQAALGSVPRSLADPLASHDTNVTGFINILDAARQAGIEHFVYAASSSTYGDEPNLPKVEDRIGNPLSPYAATKLANEIYAAVYARSYGFKAIGLRYFNVFGPRQDPEGAYAAVIPKWTRAMLRNEEVTIFGDGETSRDFCFVANAVQANIRAAFAGEDARGEVYNVAVGAQTSLSVLFALIRDGLRNHNVQYDRDPHFTDFRQGDVRHSLADIGKARRLIGYAPTHSIEQGIAEALPWYIERLG
jgi:UDP-N-acetylglucosamine 4-epimerase